MERSTITRWIGGVAIAVALGFLAGRQQQIADSQREILREIQDLKSAQGLRGAPAAAAPSAPLDFTMKIDAAATKGNADARVTLIEFSDFECPFCERHVRESYPQLERDYVNTGKIRYVFRHFPLTELHPRAMKAAEAGECARLQGKFWPLHERLFANRKLLAPPALMDHARAAGLEMKAFETCLLGQAAPAVLADIDAGRQAGISATPTFFLGFAQRDGTVRVVEKLVGAKSYGAFQSVLDRMLASPESGKQSGAQ